PAQDSRIEVNDCVVVVCSHSEVMHSCTFHDFSSRSQYQLIKSTTAPMHSLNENRERENSPGFSACTEGSSKHHYATARVSRLGRTEDSREAAAPLHRA